MCVIRKIAVKFGLRGLKIIRSERKMMNNKAATVTEVFATRTMPEPAMNLESRAPTTMRLVLRLQPYRRPILKRTIPVSHCTLEKAIAMPRMRSIRFSVSCVFI
jgi:hypothetical protein